MRHDLESRQHFAEMAGVQGDVAVAKVAGVRAPTVGEWRRRFGVAPSGPIDASSLPQMDAMSLVPVQDQKHELAVGAATLEARLEVPSAGDSDEWREHGEEFMRHFRAYVDPDAPVGALVHHARRMVEMAHAMMRKPPKGMGGLCQKLIVDAELECMAIEHAAGLKDDE